MSHAETHTNRVSSIKLALMARSAREKVGATLAADPIAIVGIGCRFPGGGNDPESFWYRPYHQTGGMLENGTERARMLSDSAPPLVRLSLSLSTRLTQDISVFRPAKPIRWIPSSGFSLKWLFRQWRTPAFDSKTCGVHAPGCL